MKFYKQKGFNLLEALFACMLLSFAMISLMQPCIDVMHTVQFDITYYQASQTLKNFLNLWYATPQEFREKNSPFFLKLAKENCSFCQTDTIDHTDKIIFVLSWPTQPSQHAYCEELHKKNYYCLAAEVGK